MLIKKLKFDMQNLDQKETINAPCTAKQDNTRKHKWFCWLDLEKAITDGLPHCVGIRDSANNLHVVLSITLQNHEKTSDLATWLFFTWFSKNGR